MVHQDNGEDPEGGRGDGKTPEKWSCTPSASSMGMTLAGANGAGPGLRCSSLPGASGRCPRSGFCGLGARS